MKGRIKILLFILAYLNVCAVDKLISMMDISSNYYGVAAFGYNAIAFLVFAFVLWLLIRFAKAKEKQMIVGAGALGGILSILTVWGTYAHFKNDIFSDPALFGEQILLFLGMLILFVPLVYGVFDLMQFGAKWYGERIEEEKTKEPGRATVFFEKHPKIYFVSLWLFLFACDLPVFLVNWPGNFVFDAQYQMAEVLTGSYKTHHPLLHTLFMGKAYQLGDKIGNVSLGYSFYTLLQMAIMSLAFAFFLYFLKERKVLRTVRILMTLWFGLFPMHNVFAITATKDVLCAGFFLIFMTQLFRFLYGQTKKEVLDGSILVIAGVLSSMLRNNMLYALVVGFVVMILLVKEKRARIRFLIFCALIVVFTKVAQFGLVQATGAISNDSRREAMSMPIQCLARVSVYRRGELPDELYGEICQYIREEDLPNYSPYNSDAVKNNANEGLLESNMINFFKLWVKVGLKFPGEYMESILTNTMGYWYPLNQGTYVSTDIATYHTLIGLGQEIEKKDLAPGFVSKFYNDLFFQMKYREVPLLGYLFRNAVYVWFLLVCLVFAICKKKKEWILLCVIPFLYLGTCFLGPLVALRYIYALIVMEPLLLLTCLEQNVKSENEILKNPM